MRNANANSSMKEAISASVLSPVRAQLGRADSALRKGILLATVRRRKKRKERGQMPRPKRSGDGFQVRGKKGLVSYVVAIKDPTKKSGYRQIRYSGFTSRKEAEAPFTANSRSAIRNHENTSPVLASTTTCFKMR
jgi:hypothetical protein